VEANTVRKPQAEHRTGVVIVISTHIIGGPGKGLLQIVPELQAGEQVRPILCTFRRHGQGVSLFASACAERGIDVQFLAQRFHYDPRPLFQLLRLMRAHDAAIVQTHGYKENLFGLLLKLLWRKRWICFLHGTTNENLKVRLYHLMDRFLVRFADRIVSVSRELAHRTVPKPWFRKVRIVENAIAPRTTEPSPFLVAKFKRDHRIARDKVITCVGRLSPEKGQDVLMDAARLLADNGHHFQIVLAGDGPSRARLERKCEKWRLGNHVTFIGQQKAMDVVYAASDILVLPSFKEGMPNVILEAMSFGLPIVTTAVGAVPEMLDHGENCLLVPPGDPRALATALGRLLQNPEQARALGLAAKRALYPRFSIARRVDNLTRVYSELETMP
jgi:glycosyltransferase involved in cell wall biosynthesis